MKQYIFDLKIGAMFLGVEENSPQAYDFLKKYLENIKQLVRNFTSNYLKSKNWPQEKIDKELSELENGHIENTELIEDPKFFEELGRVQNDYNEKLYDMYRPKLSEEQKKKVNDYLVEIETSLKNIGNNLQ